jgi:hypothetical protein
VADWIGAEKAMTKRCKEKVVIPSLRLDSFHDDETGVGVEDSRTRLKGFREDKRFGEDKMRACHRDEVVES